jgi:hypothetical protein
MIRTIAGACGLLLALPAHGETIRTRVPQANIDAFMGSCAKDTARATCWCVVEKMNATADGQFVLDAIGLRMVNPKAARPELLQVMNRHGLRHTQATAALKRTEAIAAAAAKECE